MKKNAITLTLLCIFNSSIFSHAPEYIVPLQETLGIMKPVSADVSILVADLRYQEGSVKICEFGTGMESRYKGYDAMFGKGVMWSFFWNDFSQFKFPMWYIGPKPYTELEKKELVFHRFPELNVTWTAGLDELLSNKTFQNTRKVTYQDKDSIAGHKGLVMFRHLNAGCRDVQKFRRYNEGFLVLDTAIAPFISNKFYTNLLFLEPELAPYKPRFVLCKKKLRKNLAADIIKQFDVDRYVIKPLQEFKGRGVIIIDKKNLASTLEKIIQRKNLPPRNKKLEQKFNYSDETFSYWERDHSSHFLVEEYCPSKTIMVEGKEYDPTMRLVMILHYEKGACSVQYCDAFWKLPVRSLDDQAGNLSEKYKSLGIVPAAVSPEDKQAVYALCDKFIPKIYEKMVKIINGEMETYSTPPVL